MRIDTSFEGARATILSADSAQTIRLGIPSDNAAPRFKQWFSFAVEDVEGQEIAITIEDARACTWGDAFGSPYKVWASEDRSEGARWSRTESTLGADGHLRIHHAARSKRVAFAYYPPYTTARLGALLARVTRAELARVREVGKSGKGTSMPVVEVGRNDVAPVWIIAQQHPGEPMAAWMVEGLLERLADPEDRLAAECRARIGFAIVPQMNPDGVVLGNHRTNAAGFDLNRQWAAAPNGAPEVRCVRDAIRAAGVALFLDVHGDERLPYVFVHGTRGIPHFKKEIAEAQRRFTVALLRATPDFQTEHGYPKERRRGANLGIAANQVAETFGCLSLTVEMPYSDHLTVPHPDGFTPERAKRLGADMLPAILEVAR